MKILIADDQTLMRDGLKTILDLEDDFEVVACAKTGLEAYNLAAKFTPDIILMDIRMPELNGVESTRLIMNDLPQTKIIMLTTFDDDEYIIDALKLGAVGYLLKDIEGDKLIKHIREAYTGDLLIPSKIAIKLASRLSTSNTQSHDALHNKPSAAAMTDTAANVNNCNSNKVEVSVDNTLKQLKLSARELEIASMMIKGMSNQQIASKLYISIGTAKNYISSLYEKIGINDRTNAVLFLREHIV